MAKILAKVPGAEKPFLLLVALGFVFGICYVLFGIYLVFGVGCQVCGVRKMLIGIRKMFVGIRNVRV